MSPERIDRIREIYLAALDHDPEDRAIFIKEACRGDLEMLAKVESLVDAREKADRLFEKPAWESLVPSTPRNGKVPPGEEHSDPALPFERIKDFRLIKRLGGGGMGVVYLAEQETLGRHVALKMIHPDRIGSFEAAKRFWREVDAISKLRHPNIVTVFESGEEQGIRYFAMELVPGNDLDQELREAEERSERLSTPRILGWGRDIARALDCAHRAGIIHRDVKPSNIRIAPEGRAMLMDFGVARHMKLSTITLTGEFRGTPHYASPEQVQAKPLEIDARSDIYSLGVVLYEAVTGRVPFMGETTEQVFRQILHRDPLPPRRLNPAISRDVETVIGKAMEKEPGRRYRTMGELADDLERILAGEMILARPAGLATRIWKRVRRNPVLSVAVGVALAATAALVLSLPWYLVRVSAERDKALRESERNEILFKLSRRMLGERLNLPIFEKENPRTRFDKVAREVEKAFPDSDEYKAWYLEASALFYRGHKYLDKAIDQMRAALDLRRSIQGPEHPETQESMILLANALWSHSYSDEAVELIRSVIEIRERSLGKEHPKVLATLDDLASMHSSRGEYAEAEEVLGRLIDVRRRVLGNYDPKTIETSIDLADALRKQGQYSEAEPLFRQAFEFNVRVFSFSCKQVQSVLRRVTAFYISWGMYEKADEYRARVRLSGSAAAAVPAVDGTTRTDGVADTGRTDIGYHYPLPATDRQPREAEGLPIPETAIFVPDTHATIQQAILAAVDGDTIVVRAGCYKENLNFRGKGVTVRSESGPELTVIDGIRSGSTVVFDSGEDPRSRLEGFTITNGSGTRSLHNLGYAYGGGIFCFNSSPTITGNIIRRNVATATCGGGGISCRSSSPLIVNNRILDNTATWAGGIHLDSSFATIEGNTISGNAAVQGFSGGISCYYSSPLIRNNVITRNRTDRSGGGIFIQESSPVIVNNVIAWNLADVFGGGVYIWKECFPVFTCNTVFRNGSGTRGGGLFISADVIEFTTVSHTIIRENTALADPEISLGAYLPHVSFSNVRGGFPGRGNFDADPLFADPDNGDFRLRQDPCQPGVINPCVDAGSERSSGAQVGD